MEEIILTDKTEITIKEGASLNSITAVVEQFKDLDPIASALMKAGNLDTVEFKHEDEVTGSYTDMRLEYPLFQVNVVNEKVEATFAIREKTEEEKRLDVLEKGQSVQDGSIEDLGNVVSELSEGGSL